jgi:PAS domain S-box-containing protein
VSDKPKRQRGKTGPEEAKRILVVEDSATQAEALRAQLADAGYDVTVASSGEDGLVQFGASQFDFVISDIVMPGAVDGYELCRRIKAGRRNGPPVVLLTSLSDPLDIIRGLECGADNFFTKSVEPALLLDRLQLLLTTREVRAQGELRMGVQVFFMGRQFTISSEREQILDLLVSTFEDAVRQNRDLRQREDELLAAKAELAQYAGTLEQRLQSVLESVPDVVFSVDGAMTELYYMSPACKAVLGFTADEFVADMTRWRAAIHPEDQGRVIASYRGALEAGRQATVQYRIRLPNGAEHWIEEVLIPVSEAPGTVVRLDGMARDITEQRKLEEQFRQAQKMEAVGRLAGGVAHDFNNLLTVINSYSEFLLEDLGPEDHRRQDVEEIRKAGVSAASLTRQLLAFSRQQVIEPQVLDLNAVLANAESLVKRMIGEDIEVVTVLAPQLGAVRADPGQLEQVIMNLAVNARDAMPDAGRLTLETANAEMDEAYLRNHAVGTPGRYVMLAVSDTGVGMDETTKAHIFEPFFTTKEPGKGTGLGLATVYGVVKQNGGFIWVYSEPGHGTTFKIYLPRVDELARSVSRPQVAKESLQGVETVLLVEDAVAVRAVASHTLQRQGYTVLEAPNGAAALRLAAEHPGPIHMVVTDVVMPGMNGRQFAEQLAAARPSLKVLYTSGYTDDAIVRHGVLEAGVKFLQKPFTPDALARKVREVLDSPPAS